MTDPETVGLESPEPLPEEDASLGRSVIYLGGVNVVAFASGIVRQKIFAVFLGPAGLGALSLAVTFFEVLAALVRLGVPTGLLRELSRLFGAGEEARAFRIFAVTRRRLVMVAFGVAVLVSLASKPLSDSVFQGALPTWAVPLLAFTVPLLLASELGGSVINGLERVALLARVKLFTILGGLALTVWLVVSYGLVGGILQISAGAVVGLIVVHLALRRVVPGKLEARVPESRKSEVRESLGRIMGVGLAVAVYHLAVSANHLVFRAVVVAQSGLADNGIYQATLGLSRQYVGALMGGAFIYLYPRLSARASEKPSFAREVADGLAFLFTLAVPVAFLELGFRDWIARLLFAREFLPMVPLMGLSVPGDVLAIVLGTLRLSLLATGRSRRYVVAGLGAELLYLGLFLVGLHLWGLEGAVGAYLVMSAVMIPVYLRALEVPLLARLDRRNAVHGLAALGAIVFLVMLPAGRWPVRVAAVVLAGAWGLLRRRELVRGMRP